MSHTSRIIILVDMDCFYCQVEEKLDPSLKGKPIAVVQYNEWRGGGIIAVNYPAREKGVTRHMRGDEARKKCPEIILAKVPEARGKADLTKYREAGKRVAEVLKAFTPLLERASVDEAYLDITEAVNKRMDKDFERVIAENMKNTYVVGCDINDFLHNVQKNREYSEDNCKLAMGGLIAEEIRAEIYKRTGYKCSAGIAHNKILAKLVCGLHKPNKQTILPQEFVPVLYKDLPIRKIRSLGGKFGNSLAETLNITNMGQLYQFSERALAEKFDEKTANWLYNIARGINLEPVTVRLVSKSIGCSKKFPGRSALITHESIIHWMNELASEIIVRLEKDLEENNRRAKQMVVSFAQKINKKDISSSRSLPLTTYDQTKIAQNGVETIRKFCLKSDDTYHITFLGISAGNFEGNKKKVNITTLFKNIRELNNLEKHSHQGKSGDKGTNLFPDTKNIRDSNLIDTENINNVSKSSLNEQKICVNEIGNNSLKETGSAANSDDENTSVYSATTEELNEDPKSLIYYDDIYPDSVASKPIFEKKCPDDLRNCDVSTSNGSENSTNKIFSENSCSDGVRNPSSSFFTKYFESFATDENCKSPVKRNFDTSKILEESEIECSTEDINLKEVLLQTANVTEDNNLASHANKEVKEAIVDYSSTPRETCPECNKKILLEELPSHMDYHYALKIVRDEAHLYKPTTNTMSPTKVQTEKKPITQGIKRKLGKEVQETKPILAFFQKEKLNKENSELCAECNNRIKLEDISSHVDYHAAKKLHLEINSCCPPASDKMTSDKTSTKNKKSGSVKVVRNIHSFFKLS